MQPEYQRRAIAKYHEKCVTKTVQFSPRELDLVEFVKTKGQFATYVKQLIRAEMQKESR